MSRRRKKRGERYRKVSVAIWNDEKFLSLSDDGQLLFLFMLTHPSMTGLGAMRASLPGLAAEKRWSLERLSDAFMESSIRGMAEYDEGTCCLWLPNFIKHNPPENPNVVTGWLGAYRLIPECNLKTQALLKSRLILEDFSKAFREAFRKAFPQAFTQDFGQVFAKQEQRRGRLRGLPRESFTTDLNQNYRGEAVETGVPSAREVTP